jgi:SAM-dependent methyltransferase
MATAYDRAFFSFVADDSLRNARLVVPLVMELLSPKSVVDVSCGPCAWLRAFVENGVSIIRGIDGEYVERDKLLIDPFFAGDLTEPINFDCIYDLAVCIEVAEHLPESAAANLIEQLSCAAPAVLLSAALPGQEGVHHVNEQWLSYLRELFAKKGFTMIDALRPRIRDDARIAFYIRQNLVLFLNDVMVASRPALRRLVDDECESEGEWVHVDLYKRWLLRVTADPGVKEILRGLPAAIFRSPED